MAWIFEPQRDLSDSPDETRFVPCPLAEAEIVAVFEGEAGDAEPDYVGDVDARAFRRLLKTAK